MSGTFRISVPNLRPLSKAAIAEQRQSAVASERRACAYFVALFPSQQVVADALGISLDSIQRYTTTNERYAREVPAWVMRRLRELVVEHYPRNGTVFSINRAAELERNRTGS